jgi:hypothetical protein
MTPETYQHLIDQFDQSLAEPTGQLAASTLPADLEAAQERQLLEVALDVIRYDALYQEVQKVRASLQAEHSTPVQAPASTIPLYTQRETAPSAVVYRFFSNSMKVAAVLVFALCIAGLGKFIFTSPTRVYDQYFSSYAIGAARGSSEQSSLDEAYRAMDWAKVQQAFASTASKTGKDYFLTAMASMEQKNYPQAIGLLKTLLQINEQLKEPKFQDEAEYYLAMSYLANHEPARAIPILQKIKADPNHLFNKKVKDLSDVDMLILRAK